MNDTIYSKYIKRLLDVIFSGIALIILSPLMITIGILVRVRIGSPVIFSQERPGLNEKKFTMYKFRTMTEEKDDEGNLLPDSQRLIKFGKLLRSTSLDELPELWNIFIGDMSIIGPRPLALQYLPYYTKEERRRHSVRPGLSGLAQINGRNDLQWEERFSFDIEYVDNITFMNDIKIVILTIQKTFKRESISVRGTNSIIDFDEYRKKSMGGKK